MVTIFVLMACFAGNPATNARPFCQVQMGMGRPMTYRTLEECQDYRRSIPEINKGFYHRCDSLTVPVLTPAE